MADKLELYNHALRNIGETKLASLTEDREPRYLLDDVYDNNFIDKILEEGLWNFAIRTTTISYNPSIVPTFGYRYAFDKPADYVITAAISASEYFRPPLHEYDDESDWWYCNLQTIYVKYVSNDVTDWGGQLLKWTESFEDFASWKLSYGIVAKVTGDKEKVAFAKDELKKSLMNARSKDALNQPTVFQSGGSWVNSRSQGNGQNDFGNKGKLIG